MRVQGFRDLHEPEARQKLHYGHAQEGRRHVQEGVSHTWFLSEADV